MISLLQILNEIEIDTTPKFIEGKYYISSKHTNGPLKFKFGGDTTAYFRMKDGRSFSINKKYWKYMKPYKEDGINEIELDTSTKLIPGREYDIKSDLIHWRGPYLYKEYFPETEMYNFNRAFISKEYIDYLIKKNYIRFHKKDK